jgi:uncharacterized protein YjbI with pentapeptide repeats
MAIVKQDAWYRAFVSGEVQGTVGKTVACMAADGRTWSQRELIELARSNANTWNEWHDSLPSFRWYRSQGRTSWVPGVVCTIVGADLRKTNFDDKDLTWIDFVKCNLSRASFQGAHIGHGRKFLLANATRFIRCSLRGSVFRGYLGSAMFQDCDLRSSEFNAVKASRADFSNSKFSRALLVGSFDDVALLSAKLGGSYWHDVRFIDTDLSLAHGLMEADILGPTVLDHRTLWRSGPLPQEFYRRCGFPEIFVDYLPSMVQQAINLSSCFISYSSQDGALARRLYLDLQKYKVRTFFAPKDLKIGARIRDDLEAAIHTRDKLLLILSKHSISSQWVEYEVEAAFARERSEGASVLFPITVDDEVFRTDKSWAAALRRQRHMVIFEVIEMIQYIRKHYANSCRILRLKSDKL